MSRIDWALAGAGVVLGLAAMAVDHLVGDDPGLEDPPAFLISAAIILAITTLLFGRVVRRARDPSRASLIVALLAVASLPLIWLGVPFAVAPAAIALGKRANGRSAWAAVAIGSVVLLLVTGAYTYDAIGKLST
jgi:drug/metabolite transporter (DMT)-like permease